ncbi:MAG: carbonic anhydrase [Rickettsiales bacterium]|jgi:carbonic anhydrase
MPENLKYIVSGYKKFRKKYFSGEDQLYQDLKNGQSPKILVIACSDSRVDPAIILNCKPGDLFVVRNVANLVPPFTNDGGYHGTSAALEFGVLGLGIKHIIILGHSSCGGIQALVEDSSQIKAENFISKWMEIAKPALQKTIQNYPSKNLGEKVGACAKFALIDSLNNLLTFPWIKNKVEDGNLSVRSWYFNIDSGVIEEFDVYKEQFMDLKID